MERIGPGAALTGRAGGPVPHEHMPAPGFSLSPGLPVPLSTAATLQEFAASIENWDEFSTANNYVWNSSLPTCVWKGVTCSFAGRIQAL